MPNWRERGEVPDSDEDDEDFESQNDEATLLPAADATSEDIWAFPGSQEEKDATEQKFDHPSPLADPPHVDSSPLSSAPSEDLPRVNDLTIARIDQTFSKKAPENTEQPSEPSAALPDSTSGHGSPPDPIQGRDRGTLSADDPSLLFTSQSVPQGKRSLRPRKPIQEHPYLLENERYSRILKKHGVKPLRLALQAGQNPEPCKSAPDDVFDQASQESTQDMLAQHSWPQETRADTQVTGLSDDPFSASSQVTSTPHDTSRPDSPASFQGTTGLYSLDDQDLPELDEILGRPLRATSTKETAKRQRTPPPSTIRKRRKVVVLDSNPEEALAAPFLKPMANSGSSVILSPHLPPLHPKLSRQDGPPTTLAALSPLLTSPSGRRNSFSADFSLNKPASDNGVSDLDEANESCESRSDTDEDEDEDAFNSMRRRLRGVLPASWLRLDQNFTRQRALEHIKTRRRLKSPEQRYRRGVAQLKKASPSGAAPQIFFDDDSEDEGQEVLNANSPPGNPVSTPPAVLAETNSNFNKVVQIISDDSDSAFEDNHIDLMMPLRATSRKRQLKITDSINAHRKRHNPGKISENGRQKPSATKRQRVKSRQLPPPRLGILDVIEADAPSFLKVAARTIKKRQNQGRSSPRRKLIQLATRQDHVDAISVLDDWKAASIPQRDSVTLAARQISKVLGQKVEERRKLVSYERAPIAKPRRLFKRVCAGGSISFGQLGKPEPSAPALQRGTTVGNSTRNRALTMPMHQAQLEIEEKELRREILFHKHKRMLDCLYQTSKNLSIPSTLSVAEADDTAAVEAQSTVCTGPNPLQQSRGRGSRFRKSTRPCRINVEAPQYSHANGPLIVENFAPADFGIAETDVDQSKLRGLGPYGTDYSHHFETFPIETRVFFHESTLLGSGILAFCSNDNFACEMPDSRPRAFMTLDGRILRCGPWDVQVSSEIGILLDMVTEQIENELVDDLSRVDKSVPVSAASFILTYVKDSVTFTDESDVRSFAARLYECLLTLNQRVGPTLDKVDDESKSKLGLILMVYDRLLLTVLIVLKIVASHSTAASLTAERVQMEDLLTEMAKTVMSILCKLGSSPMTQMYEDLKLIRPRERGIRGDRPSIHSWVLVMRVLDIAHMPRASFWDVLHAVMVSPAVVASGDAAQYERCWELVFSLLPLTQFNKWGIVDVGDGRPSAGPEGWTIAQSLLKTVLCAYQRNNHQPPSFNNYCRALVARCYYLVQHWGWRKSGGVVGTIFDFFGSQNLAHLRNEEADQSPRFIEELARRPKLDIEPSDRCFHIFLKLVALSIGKMDEAGAAKDIRNLVARMIPNHNRQYLRDQAVHARELAALRNHHDLLGTLFWAAPVEMRPAVSLMERLVVPGNSHKAACLINLRCWRQLSRFIVASGEASRTLRPLTRWRDTFFQQVLDQFHSVAPDVQQQVLAYSRQLGERIGDQVVNETISLNKRSVMDILYASVESSLDVMQHAPNLESATFCFNPLQLRTVFEQSLDGTLGPDWAMLRACLATLGSFLTHIETSKDKEESQPGESQAGTSDDKEESQQSDYQISNSVLADDALMQLDQNLANVFFSLARRVLLMPGEHVETAQVECLDQMVVLAARMTLLLVDAGVLRLCDMFGQGRFGLFDGTPHKLDLHQRRYLHLFVLTMLQRGFNDWTGIDFDLLELWVSILVQPRDCLAYETSLGSELWRRRATFVPESVMSLVTRPDYPSNVALFEFAVSDMRQRTRLASKSTQGTQATNGSRNTLKLMMEQIKSDLKTLSANDPPEHGSYVKFVQDIISLVKSHGSDMCAIDDYFYQISKEYAPSAQDPQLQVAKLVSYGLRLEEGDGKAARPLFFLLLNNVKSAMMKDELRREVVMLYKGMQNWGVAQFVLSKMLPAIILSCLRNSSAFPLMDIYAKALQLLLDRHVFSHELTERDMDWVCILVRATVRGIHDMFGSRRVLLCASQVHVFEQVLGVLNLIWPSLVALSMTGASFDSLTEVLRSLEHMSTFVRAAKSDLEQVMQAGSETVHLEWPQPLAMQEEVQLDHEVQVLADDLAQDVERNWNMTSEAISIQTPGRRHGQDVVLGALMPVWDMGKMVHELHERAEEWCWRWLQLTEHHVDEVDEVDDGPNVLEAFVF
ncbi:hypothetical protein CDD81_2513 [Ophiocordyceps australis]|uniref:Uncharacterized protein n=1 Tax=Ophiocordyceps australis TaxID=1399860 RepID=A0A2C5XB06_9HYPO|nr:hypothetical protein CDD81_2513 [Ophiocordyceps australis]